MKRLCLSLLLMVSLTSVHAATCSGTPVHIHRGSSKFPENSGEAIIEALKSHAQGVEFDIQLLSDGEWSIHHDALTGRTVNASSEESSEHYSSSQWKNFLMFDQRKKLTDIKAPLLKDVIVAAKPYAAEGNILNIEVKGKYSCSDVQNARELVARNLSAGTYLFTSVDANALKCIRNSDPKVYLGAVALPDIKAAESRNVESKQKALDWARKHGLDGDKILKKGEQTYTNETVSRLSSPQWLKNLKTQVGSNSGLHLDAQMVLKNPQIETAVREAGFKIYIYDETIGNSSIDDAVKSMTSCPDVLIMDR